MSEQTESQTKRRRVSSKFKKLMQEAIRLERLKRLAQTQRPPFFDFRPTPKPKREPRPVIIPAAIAENRPPTIDELLDWIFKENSL